MTKLDYDLLVMNTKLQPMNNSTRAEFIVPGEEIIDIKIAINEIIEWINHFRDDPNMVNTQQLGSKSTDKDYLNKNQEEWLKASKNDGV